MKQNLDVPFYEYIWKNGLVQKNINFNRKNIPFESLNDINNENIKYILQHGIKIKKIRIMNEQQYIEHLLGYWKLNQLEEKSNILWENYLMPVCCLIIIFKLKKQKKQFQQYLNIFREWEQAQFDLFMEHRKCLQNQKLKQMKIEQIFREKVNLSIIQSVQYLGQSAQEDSTRFSKLINNNDDNGNPNYFISSKNFCDSQLLLEKKNSNREQFQLVQSINQKNQVIPEEEELIKPQEFITFDNNEDDNINDSDDLIINNGKENLINLNYKNSNKENKLSDIIKRKNYSIYNSNKGDDNINNNLINLENSTTNILDGIYESHQENIPISISYIRQFQSKLKPYILNKNQYSKQRQLISSGESQTIPLANSFA